MLFKEIVAVYNEKQETHKYKMRRYCLLEQVGHICTTRL
jgi:hypothetical protein